MFSSLAPSFWLYLISCCCNSCGTEYMHCILMSPTLTSLHKIDHSAINATSDNLKTTDLCSPTQRSKLILWEFEVRNHLHELLFKILCMVSSWLAYWTCPKELVWKLKFARNDQYIHRLKKEKMKSVDINRCVSFASIRMTSGNLLHPKVLCCILPAQCDLVLCILTCRFPSLNAFFGFRP